LGGTVPLKLQIVKTPGNFYKYKKTPLDENFWVERDNKSREKGMYGSHDICRFCAVLL
jgi:hypothetical protein